MALLLGVLLALLSVAYILHPVVAGVSAPMERDDDELTELQHRKRIALLALRDVEYDFHAGKLDEADYRAMKREMAKEALAVLDAEVQEREGADPSHEGVRGAGDREALEAEIAAVREALREGAVCPTCAHPNPRGARFCESCGSALPGRAGVGISPQPTEG